MATDAQRKGVAAFLRGMAGLPAEREAYDAVAEELDPTPTDPRREVVAKALQYLDDRTFRSWDEVSENGKDTYRIDAGHVLAALDAHDSEQQDNDTLRVGDRVRVLYAKYAEDAHGKTGKLLDVNGTFRADEDDRHAYEVELEDGDVVYARDVEKIAPSAPARYWDREGDIWTAQADGSYMLSDSASSCSIGAEFYDFDELEYEWGPLTRVR